MRRALAALGVCASLALPAAASAQPSTQVSFDCWEMKADGKLHDDQPADLTAIRHGSLGDAQATWSLTWADGRTVEGSSFEAKFGSVGGSTGIRWRADDSERMAFVSYSDERSPRMSEAFWLSLDKPSLWQPPGYMCDSGPLDNPGKVQ